LNWRDALPKASSIPLRERLEARERDTLCDGATLSAESEGRNRAEEEHAYRTAFQRDRDRILHTKAFRRLKRKTQVFLSPQGDHYRTRLTHTLEVAQISRTVARALFLNEDLAEAVALGHDLGHTPFGHAGEGVLNEIYEPGFRHWEQSLRVVDHLEATRHGQGLNLTHEVRDGILHHSMGKVILLGREGQMAATPEGRLVAVCDAIAYINHDIDDAIRAGVITLSDLPSDAITYLGDTSSERIDAMTSGLIAYSEGAHIDMAPDVRDATISLREYLYTQVYPCETIDREVRKAKHIVAALYEHVLQELQEHPTANTEDSFERQAVDRLASMTDPYALDLYRRVFFPAPWAQ
jgi:dGTPase